MRLTLALLWLAQRRSSTPSHTRYPSQPSCTPAAASPGCDAPGCDRGSSSTGKLVSHVGCTRCSTYSSCGHGKAGVRGGRRCEEAAQPPRSQRTAHGPWPSGPPPSQRIHGHPARLSVPTCALKMARKPSHWRGPKPVTAGAAPGTARAPLRRCAALSRGLESLAPSPLWMRACRTGRGVGAPAGAAGAAASKPPVPAPWLTASSATEPHAASTWVSSRQATSSADATAAAGALPADCSAAAAAVAAAVAAAAPSPPTDGGTEGQVQPREEASALTETSLHQVRCAGAGSRAEAACRAGGSKSMTTAARSSLPGATQWCTAQ